MSSHAGGGERATPPGRRRSCDSTLIGPDRRHPSVANAIAGRTRPAAADAIVRAETQLTFDAAPSGNTYASVAAMRSVVCYGKAPRTEALVLIAPVTKTMVDGTKKAGSDFRKRDCHRPALNIDKTNVAAG
jgi:hypothetical protein